MKLKLGVYLLSATLCAALFFSPVAATLPVPGLDEGFIEAADIDEQKIPTSSIMERNEINLAAALANVISTGNGSGTEGANVKIPIGISENQGISALKLEVSYDSNVLSLADPPATMRVAFDSNQVNATTPGKVIVLLNGYSNAAANYTGDEVLFELNFKIGTGVPLGATDVEVVAGEAVNLNRASVALELASEGKGSVNVVASLNGDVNCDGLVSIKDVTLLAQYLADYYGDLSQASDPSTVTLPGGGTSDFSYSASDTYQMGSEMGKVNLKDLLTLHQFVSGYLGTQSFSDASGLPVLQAN